MTFGSGEYTYRADMDWAKRPEGWTWGWTPGMACDSQGRIFVSSRCDHPLVLFDADGNFLDSWGEGILDTAAARQPVARYAHLATPAEIAENDFNLNIPRYVDTFEEEAEIDLMAVRREREQLKAELARLEAQMDAYLKELGYE